MNIENLSPRDLVAQFVIQQRGAGHFLPYDDHHFIDEWIGKAGNIDDVLVALADILPEYFKQADGSAKPKSLKGVHKRVLKAIDRIRV